MGWMELGAGVYVTRLSDGVHYNINRYKTINI